MTSKEYAAATNWPKVETAEETMRRLRDQNRNDAARIARVETIAYVAIILTAALWVVVEAAVGALMRLPA